ncbi:MAG TPA: hypothetical protein VHZ30_06650, partial [Verrucomicrobiae bacterium]|nr:hypothetical protein [Verrucomicrobiae bacterium]
MKANYKVSYDFAQLPFTVIGGFTVIVINSLTGNAGLTNLPVSLIALTAQNDDYLVKLAATAQGGTLATAAKDAAWDVLITSLRQTAAYVQSVAGQDLQLLLSSGFNAASTNRAQSPLLAPVIQGIDNNSSTVFYVLVNPVINARSYEVQIKSGADGWQTVGIFPSTRNMEIDNLTPGTL